MCSRVRPGTPSGLAALWLRVRRKASRMMVGVMQPEIIGIEDACVGRTCPSHGKGGPGRSVESGVRGADSIRAI